MGNWKMENMAAVSLFWNIIMATVTSCYHAVYPGAGFKPSGYNQLKVQILVFCFCKIEEIK